MVEIIDPERMCKASILVDVMRKACDLIPDAESREVCYAGIDMNKVVFLDANTLEHIDKTRYTIYGDLYCFKESQEVYAILLIKFPGYRRSREYMIIVKIFGSLVEWRMILLKVSDSTFVVLRKEGSRRIIIDDVKKIVEKVLEITPIYSSTPRHTTISLYK